jgi:hypothetical protein
MQNTKSQGNFQNNNNVYKDQGQPATSEMRNTMYASGAYDQEQLRQLQTRQTRRVTNEKEELGKG